MVSPGFPPFPQTGTNHYGVRANNKRFHNVARKLDAAIRYAAAIHFPGSAAGIHNCRCLRHANTSDNSCCADRARANADFNSIRPLLQLTAFAPSQVATLPATSWQSGKQAPYLADGIQHINGMSMRGIKNQNIRTGRQKLLGASNALFCQFRWPRPRADGPWNRFAGIGDIFEPCRYPSL